MKLLNNIDKLGTVGIFFTALFSPCCFPLFAFGASALGLGSFELFGGWTMWIFLAMMLVSLTGLVISYSKHRLIYPLLFALPNALLILYVYFYGSSLYLIYIGMFGLLTGTVVNYYGNKSQGSCDTCTTYNGKEVELKSTITCPSCGYKKTEMMPTDACAFFYECENCKTRLRPLEGDCCVYCSYGTIKCPPIQAGDKCC